MTYQELKSAVQDELLYYDDSAVVVMQMFDEYLASNGITPNMGKPASSVWITNTGVAEPGDTDIIAELNSGSILLLPPSYARELAMRPSDDAYAIKRYVRVK